MQPEIFWIGGLGVLRLALMPRPRGGEWLAGEVAAWREAGIDTLVCLLESGEIRELGLEEEESLCVAQGIEFLPFPIRDRHVPASRRESEALASSLAFRLQHGRSVAVHCRAGIGRSALICACVLLKLGVPRADVFPRIGTARGLAVPDTEGQIRWFGALRRKIARARLCLSRHLFERKSPSIASSLSG